MLIALMGVVVMLGFFVAFVTIPLWSSIHRIANSIGQNLTEIAFLEQKKVSIQVLSDKLKAIDPEVKQVETSFLSESEGILPFITVIERLAQQEGLDLSKESADEVSPKEQNSSLKARYRMTIGVKGDFLHLMLFLNRLENAPLRVLVNDFSFRALSGEKWDTGVRLTLFAF